MSIKVFKQSPRLSVLGRERLRFLSGRTRLLPPRRQSEFKGRVEKVRSRSLQERTTHPRPFLTYLELLEIEVAHFTEAERSGLLGEIEERELQGGAPREGKVPGRCALDLVHLAQPCRGIREGLTTRQEVRPLHGAREAPVENIDVGFDSKR